MKVAVAIACTLLISVVVGAAGMRALCDRGHCGARPALTSQASAASNTAVSGTTPAGGESTTSEPLSTASCLTVKPTPTAVTPSTSTPSSSTTITGLAIIGDSTADEYRADNQRGGEYGATTFNWVELLARERGVNLGSWGSRPEPRRDGYEYNWARSGGTSASMIYDGQHTGVAQQVNAGQVSHVIIQIGINDFYDNNVAFSIYEGQLTGVPLQQFLDGIVANIEQAVQTAKVAGEDHIILAATQDYLSPGLLPEMQTVFPDETKRQRLISAFAAVNEGLSDVAAREHVAFFDFNAALDRELENRLDPADQRFILVGGQRIDTSARGNEPSYLLVDDDFAHPGTVFSGLIANMYIQEMNATFGTVLVPFSDDEILQIAGLK